MVCYWSDVNGVPRIVKAGYMRPDRPEGKITDYASPSTSTSTPAPVPAPTPLTPSNGSQLTQLRRPPSPSPAPPPPPTRDPEPELELVIEPVDDIEAELGNAVTPSIPTEPPSTKASTPVIDGDGDRDAATAEDFKLSKAESSKLSADGFGAMDVDEDEFVSVEEVADDEDVDDMFAFNDNEKPEKKVVKKVKKSKPACMFPDGGVSLDAADDPHGYYTPTLGETLHGKYHVVSVIGRAYGSLLPDAAPKREVAIKIMRSQETMYKSGHREAALLAKFNAADPDDKGHVVRLERTRDTGLSNAAVKAYAIQIFLALNLFKKEYITHADIKPDNILVSNNKLHSKAPEIILGLPHD
ncbi:hypothetical protein DL96DRAFT_1816578 [Flagelloscypha sp. PMI_526]|nr:hypothetical protein DL96DRAFT_1816578 [Flagelloscypha sp. PMI_526]